MRNYSFGGFFIGYIPRKPLSFLAQYFEYGKYEFLTFQPSCFCVVFAFFFGWIEIRSYISTEIYGPLILQ